MTNFHFIPRFDRELDDLNPDIILVEACIDEILNGAQRSDPNVIVNPMSPSNPLSHGFICTKNGIQFSFDVFYDDGRRKEFPVSVLHSAGNLSRMGTHISVYLEGEDKKIYLSKRYHSGKGWGLDSVHADERGNSTMYSNQENFSNDSERILHELVNQYGGYLELPI